MHLVVDLDQIARIDEVVVDKQRGGAIVGARMKGTGIVRNALTIMNVIRWAQLPHSSWIAANYR